MALTCSVCGQERQASEFSRRSRENGMWRHCFQCRTAGSAMPKIEPLPITEKACVSCEETKPLAEFPLDRRRYRSQCRICYNASQFRRRTAKIAAIDIWECSICGELKSRDDFRVRKDGYIDRRCRPCGAKRTAMGRLADSTKFVMAKSIAKGRKLAFSLTTEQYLALRALPCHYCKFPLPRTGVALDRLDNALGYSADNVVPCCWACNQARNATFTPEEMLVIGQAIAQVKAARQSRGESLDITRGWGRRQKYAET